MDKTVLSVRNVTVELHSAQGRARIVNHVSLEGKRGRVVGIIGESGSGKTMTCMAMLGLLPTGAQMMEGSIMLGGKDITHLPAGDMRKLRGKRMAMIMQNPMACFNPVRTIGAHFIESLMEYSHLSKTEAREQAVECMSRVRLPRPEMLMKQYPFQLSGGMLQRAMIAIALSANPDVLIADEPTTALDAGSQKHILQELNRIRNATGTALIVITHDLGVIAELADDVVVMYRGEAVESTDVYSLFDNPVHPYTRLLLASRTGSSRWVSGQLKGRLSI